MFELFVIGSFWFWALVIAELALLVLFVENESGLWATVSLILFAVLLQFFGNADLIGFITASPLTVVSILGAYFLLGAIWGVVKWWIFCHDRLEEYEELKAEFLQERGVTDTKVVPPELRDAWRQKITYRDHRLGQPPRVREHKSRVLRWMSFWCIDLIWSICHDFVKRVFRTIYRRIAEFLQRIADNMFARAGVEEDLAD